jgi:hypothetical protein
MVVDATDQIREYLANEAAVLALWRPQIVERGASDDAQVNELARAQARALLARYDELKASIELLEQCWSPLMDWVRRARLQPLP